MRPHSSTSRQDFRSTLSYDHFLDACGTHSERKNAVTTPPTGASHAFSQAGGSSDADAPSPFNETSDASPLVLPSTARGAVAGAKAPAVEGFDTLPPPRDRAPRPEAGQSAPVFPSAAAIEAAKAAIRPAVRNGEQPIVSTSQPKEPK